MEAVWCGGHDSARLVGQAAGEEARSYFFATAQLAASFCLTQRMQKQKTLFRESC